MKFLKDNFILISIIVLLSCALIYQSCNKDELVQTSTSVVVKPGATEVTKVTGTPDTAKVGIMHRIKGSVINTNEKKDKGIFPINYSHQDIAISGNVFTYPACDSISYDLSAEVENLIIERVDTIKQIRVDTLVLNNVKTIEKPVPLLEKPVVVLSTGIALGILIKVIIDKYK